MPIKGYAKELVRSRTGRDPDELIRELYVDKRATDREIAEALGVSRSTAQEWRQQLGITRDDRPAVAL